MALFSNSKPDIIQFGYKPIWTLKLDISLANKGKYPAYLAETIRIYPHPKIESINCQYSLRKNPNIDIENPPIPFLIY